MLKADVSQHEYTRDSYEYLATGGLDEVIGFTDLARKVGHHKVQSDTDMMTAILMLAAEALEARKNSKRGVQ